MRRVGSEQYAREAKLGHQLWHGCDLMRRPGQPLVRRNQGGAGESAKYVDCLAIGQMVETAAQGFANEGNCAQSFWGATRAQIMDMAVEGASRLSRPSVRNRWRSVLTAGAGRKQALRTVFRHSRWRAMKAMIVW